jgi:hypothetical protein
MENLAGGAVLGGSVLPFCMGLVVFSFELNAADMPAGGFIVYGQFLAGSSVDCPYTENPWSIVDSIYFTLTWDAKIKVEDIGPAI